VLSGIGAFKDVYLKNRSIITPYVIIYNNIYESARLEQINEISKFRFFKCLYIGNLPNSSVVPVAYSLIIKLK
jgi:hypothetical protein